MPAPRVRGLPAGPWINVIAAIVGGVMLGFGLGRFVHHPSVVPGTTALVGLLVLWYAISDRRKAKPGTPESEDDGERTIE